MKKRQKQEIVETKKEYTVAQMVSFLKKEWGIDYHNIGYGVLKTKAVIERSYLLDLACDIKELLTENGIDKYFYIDWLLEEFKNELGAT